MGSTCPLPPPRQQDHVVCLADIHCPVPAFSFPHCYTSYPNTSPAEVLDRIRDATIIITTVIPITPYHLDQSPHVRLIAVYATGVEWVDREDCARRRLSVINCPGSNIPAVSEHALGLYFAARRKTVEMHNRVLGSSEWRDRGTLTHYWAGQPSLSCSGEVMGIIGYGALGKRIEMLARAVGFKDVVVSERKGKEVAEGSNRLPFQEMLTKVSVLVLCCPRNPSTMNLIGEEELRSMRKDAVVINVARGGIVNETALAKALRQGWIAAAATDVFEIEPAVKGGSPLIPTDEEEPVPNLTLSPHIAWFAVETLTTLQRLLKEGVEAYVAGKPINLIVHDGKVY